MFKVSLAFRMVTVHRYASSLSSRHMVPVEVMEESDSDEDISRSCSMSGLVLNLLSISSTVMGSQSFSGGVMVIVGIGLVGADDGI